MINMDSLVQQVLDEPFLDGVTFSGGDPFQQPDKFAYLAKKLKEKNINIWIYTGYTFEELLELAKTNESIDEMIHNCDVIVDGPFVQDLYDPKLLFRGSSNQRIIDVKKTLETKSIIKLIE